MPKEAVTVVVDGMQYVIKPTPPLYIAPTPYSVQLGIDSYNRGEPFPELPARCMDSQSQCDFRMGWHIGEADAHRNRQFPVAGMSLAHGA